MLRQLSAIAVLTVRSASRTRMFQYVLGFAILAAITLPLLIRGDGSVESNIRISIEYTLRLVTFILAIASMWAAAGTTSLEIDSKQIHLIVTKPVTPLQIWLGKWLGLIAVNAALLLLTGICIATMLRWHLRQSRLSPEQWRAISEEVMTAREPVLPSLPGLEQKIQERANEIEAGITPGALSRESLVENARRDVIRSENTVQPGASQRWVFPYKHGGGRGGQMSIRYMFSSPRQLDLQPLAVRWIVRDSTGATAGSHDAQVFAGQPHSFEVSPGGETDVLTAEFFNAQTNPPSTVVFARDMGVTLLLPGGSFEGNLARALIMIFCKLAVLTALGLTIGSCFSMPVAVFAAFAIIAAFNLTALIASTDIGEEVSRRSLAPTHGFIDRVVALKFKAADALFAPIRRYDPVPRLQRSELVPWPLVAQAFLLEVLLYPSILGLCGVLILKHRQFGLPSG